MKNELIEIYKAKGILGEHQEFKPLGDSCKHCDSCWQDIDSKLDKGYGIYLPWIGVHYSSAKIVVLGINLNDIGDLDAQVELAKLAKEELNDGKNKIFKSETYGGTPYWYVLPQYVIHILNCSGIKVDSLSMALDYIAVTTSIKCTIDRERAIPTQNMWNNCPEHILKEEVVVLKPNTILILGKSDNYWNFKNSVAVIIEEKQEGNFIIGTCKIGTIVSKFIVTPHPTAFGGYRRYLTEFTAFNLKF
jgi:hypothetical protein